MARRTWRSTSSSSTPSARQPRTGRTRSLRSWSTPLMWDVVVIIGGYNSSNTNNLAIIASERVKKSYHIASGECIEGDLIRHKPAGRPLDIREEVEERDWLPEGEVRVGSQPEPPPPTPR